MLVGFVYPIFITQKCYQMVLALASDNASQSKRVNHLPKVSRQESEKQLPLTFSYKMTVIYEAYIAANLCTSKYESARPHQSNQLSRREVFRMKRAHQA